MPKSKNRRKPKSSRPQAEVSADTQIVEAETVGTKSERVEQPAPTKEPFSPFRFFRWIVQFFRQVRSEMQKVTWTTRGETTVSTIMVLIMVTIMSLFFFTVDQFLRFIVPLILSLNFS
ncbi:MAG: preprotein translocase subunit SecE [Pseudomonadota bacterium]